MLRPYRKILRNQLLLPMTPFYRRYPYRGGASIKSVDARGCIDLELNFFCNRIPKSANSTVVTSLAKWRFNKTIPSRAAKKMFLPPSALTRSEVDNLEVLFCFAVVRNPFTRVLSAYLDKVERKEQRRGNDSSFEDFLAGLSGGELHSNAHWTPQADLLLLPLQNFDFIGKVESLDQDLDKVRQQLLGGNDETDIVPALSNATNANSKIDRYYTADCADTVRKLYARDFELFNYSTALPS